MGIQRFTMESPIGVSADEAFAWHARPGAFERLLPPWQRVEIVERTGAIRDGDRVTLRVRAGPVWTRWVIEHRGTIEGRRFCDVQRTGPFAHWEHTHEFVPISQGECRVRDHIEFELPAGPVRGLFGWSLQRKLRRAFGYRHRTTADDLRMHAACRDYPRQTVAVSGAGGLIGRALCALLTTGGHRVLRLVRRPAVAPGEAQWAPDSGVVDMERLKGLDAVVHLAGESIAAGRWTRRRMEAIRRSRVDATQALVGSLARLTRPPATLVCASAVGIYGDRGGTVLDESSPPGEGFLSGVCQAWEQAAQAAAASGMRCAVCRFGVVLTPVGGMLARLLPVFRWGLGGPVGSGRQYVSWISIDDAIGAIHHVLMNDDLTGPVNVVSPEPVANRELASVLGRVLNRPAFLRVPATAARAAFGRLADEAILASTRAAPAALTRSDYQFRHPHLEGALRHLLGHVGG